MSRMKISLLLLTALLLSACSDKLMNDIPLIEIDPVFGTSGFTDVNVVSLNEKETYNVTYSRNYGISRSLTMNLTVDEDALKTYNAENNTDYVLLPVEYYSMPGSVTFEIKGKNANFAVEIFAKKLYEAAGSVDAAKKYVLPVKAVPTEQTGVKNDEASNMVLLHVNMLPATVSVYVPSGITTLEFVADSGSEESMTITCSQNFTGVDPSRISAEADKTANLIVGGVQYKLLPDENYQFEPATLNAHSEVEIRVKINAGNLSDEFEYLLPCRVKTSNTHYQISQADLIYYAVNITDLTITILDASQTKAKKAYGATKVLKGFIDINMNSLVGEDISIEFIYDPSLIDAFNAANKANFNVLPYGSVEITNGKIAGGYKSIKIPYEFQMSSLAFNDGTHYLVPFVLQDDKLEMGHVAGSNVIYLDVAKTLEGEYGVTIIENGRTRGGVGNSIWPASKCARAGDAEWDAVIDQAQYGFVSDTGWDGYCTLFSVTDEDMPGKANCKKIVIHTFLELIVENGGTNEIRENNSYFNTETGEIYIDCLVYESWFQQAYKEVYSFKKS